MTIPSCPVTADFFETTQIGEFRLSIVKTGYKKDPVTRVELTTPDIIPEEQYDFFRSVKKELSSLGLAFNVHKTGCGITLQPGFRGHIFETRSSRAAEALRQRFFTRQVA